MSSDAAPTVSVVIPVFDSERFLAEAIESVFAQRHAPLEVIVVDDGSTDETPDVAGRYGDAIRYYRQENRGTPAARNRGVELATGELIAFLDADDLYSPDKLALQLPRLEARPDTEIVLGFRQYYMLEDDGTGFRKHMEPMMALQLACGLFRASVFSRIGPFDEGLRLTDDWNWFMRARELGVRLLIHRDVVLHQRIHEANITRQRELGRQETLLLVRESLARRRQAGVSGSLPPLSSYFEGARDEDAGADHGSGRREP